MKAPRKKQGKDKPNSFAENLQMKPLNDDEGESISPPSFNPTANQHLDSKLAENFGPYKNHATEFMQRSGADISDVEVKKDD